MHKTTINFVHANGFPSGSYQTLFNYLPNSINVIALDKYGHNPKYPIENNWQCLVEELADFVKSQQVNHEKVICVGHSFGGVLSFMAACKYPELFKQVIMLDPPVLNGATALAVKLIKKVRMMDKFTPSGKAKNRRTHWPLDARIAKSFSGRTLFKNFDSRSLNDYINSGVIERNGRLELLFDANIEANIFRHLPCNLATFKNKLTVPTTLIYGEQTDVCPHHIFKRFANSNKKITLKTISGGHMFPMERPETVAALITEIAGIKKASYK
jgi:pimeloyl-ACP methyl ester carboxylesterase